MPVRSRRTASLVVLLATLGGLIGVVAGAPPASADLASLKSACTQRDALDNDTSNGVTLPYTFCDDGVPEAGGRKPNEGAVKAVAVPQRYAGHEGLPEKTTPDPDAGADSDGNIALDVDLSLPDPTLKPVPAG